MTVELKWYSIVLSLAAHGIHMIDRMYTLGMSWCDEMIHDAIDAHSCAELIHEFWWANSSLTQTSKHLTKLSSRNFLRSPSVCVKPLFAHQNSWITYTCCNTFERITVICPAERTWCIELHIQDRSDRPGNESLLLSYRTPTITVSGCQLFNHVLTVSSCTPHTYVRSIVIA